MVRCTLSDIWRWMLTKVTSVVAAIFSEKQQSKSAEHINEVKDSMKDKKKNHVSGSVQKLEDGLEKLESLLEFKEGEAGGSLSDLKIFGPDSEINLKDVEEALQAILDDDWGQEVMQENASPIYMLDLGKQSDLFYSVQRKTFVSIRDKSEVVPIESPAMGFIGQGYYLVNNEIFSIDPSKVVEIGWN